MASEPETPGAAAPEPMELSTPFKEEQAETTEAQTPTPTPTPRKRGRPAKGKTSTVGTPKTPTKGARIGNDNGNGNAEAGPAGAASPGEDEDAITETEASPSKKGKSSSTSGSATKKVMGPIPTSYEGAGASDRLLLRMRDEDGANWPEINEAWMAMTGITVGRTTLRMRYRTMKNNFVSVEFEDEVRLLQAKHEVEERFEVDKWAKIADLIEANGGKKYPAVSLQKKFKTMVTKPAGLSAACGSLFGSPSASALPSASTNATGTRPRTGTRTGSDITCNSATTATGDAELTTSDVKEEEA